MTGQARTEHLGYIQAVVGELEALDIKTGGLIDRARFPASMVLQDISRRNWPKPDRRARPAAPNPSRRATAIIIPQSETWPWRGDDDVHAEVMWDEEFGWTVSKTIEPGSHGTVHLRWDLGLELVPEPAEVALRVEAMLNTEGGVHHPFARQRRKAANDNPRLEMALAYYLPI